MVSHTAGLLLSTGALKAIVDVEISVALGTALGVWAVTDEFCAMSATAASAAAPTSDVLQFTPDRDGV
jgi:hypothetical protein